MKDLHDISSQSNQNLLEKFRVWSLDFNILYVLLYIYIYNYYIKYILNFYIISSLVFVFIL